MKCDWLKFFLIASFIIPHAVRADLFEGDFERHPRIACELLLHSPPESLLAGRMFYDLVGSIVKTVPAYRDPGVSAEEILAFGVSPNLANPLKMRIEHYRGHRHIYWLKLIGPTGPVRSFPLHAPPIYIWRDVNLDHGIKNVDLRWDLAGQDPRTLQLGGVYELFEDGRTFVSLRSLDAQHVRVAAGIDVMLNSDQRWPLRPIEDPLFIVGSMADRIFRRVEVYSAVFSIKPKPPARKTK